MKKLFIIMMMGILLPLSLFAQQSQGNHDWTVNSTYESTMTFTIEVQNNGATAPSFEIGAFCGTECRGIATSQYIPQLSKYLWFLVIYGEGGEAINFFVRDNGVEQNAVTTYNVEFTPNGIVGYPATPQVVNFIFPVARDYTMISDASQLVAGRRYFIANGNNGNVMAMGRQGNGKRFSAAVEITNQKANFIPAVNSMEDQVFVFTLGTNETDWSLFDEVSGGYLETEGDRFDLNVDAVAGPQSKWQITVNANGTTALWNAAAQYYMAFYDGQGFYCSDNPSQLYIFAECELVSGEMASLNVTDNVSMYVVPSGSTLTVGDLSTVNASNLIVEDGAQLVNASAGVLATLQKGIVAYKEVDVADGWYTIASPLASGSVAACSNLTTPDFDLYEYDETNLNREEWRNYKYQGNFTGFTPGRGYLYANSNDMTVNMFGTLNASNVSVALTYTGERPDLLKGFNLIGNPFPHAIYKGSGAAIDDSRLADGYYVLSNDGTWQVRTCTDPILPGMGIMVVTSETGNITIAKTTAAATGESSGSKRGMEGKGGMDGKGRISLRVSDGTKSDAAYLYGGEEGRNLRKMSHMNTSCPELSFHCDGERYAIAHLDKGEGTVDVRFDHQSAASCTMTWDVEDWRGSHPYLVDNMTGTVIDMTRMSSYAFEAGSHEHPFRFKLVLDEGFEAPGLVISNLEGEGIAQIIDMNGRLLLTQEYNSSLLTTNFSLAPGVYILRIISGNQVSTQKIVF